MTVKIKGLSAWRILSAQKQFFGFVCSFYSVSQSTEQDINLKSSSLRVNEGKWGQLANQENFPLCKRADICNTSMFGFVLWVCLVWFMFVSKRCNVSVTIKRPVCSLYVLAGPDSVRQSIRRCQENACASPVSSSCKAAIRRTQHFIPEPSFQKK